MDDIKNTLIDLYAENTKADYLPELAFYNLIADTDLKIVRDYLNQPFSKTIGLGALSRDPLQNLKYHFAVTVARQIDWLLLFCRELHHAIVVIPKGRCRSNHHIAPLQGFILTLPEFFQLNI